MSSHIQQHLKTLYQRGVHRDQGHGQKSSIMLTLDIQQQDYEAPFVP